jgi:hypothetical protein
MSGPNVGTATVIRPRVNVQDRLVAAHPDGTASERTPFSCMFPSVIGKIGSLHLVTAWAPISLQKTVAGLMGPPVSCA